MKKHSFTSPAASPPRLLAAGLLLLTLLPLLGGCGRKRPKEPVPTERNRLVIRMFNSMAEHRYDAAAEQAGKVLAIDPGNVYLATIVEAQRVNECIAAAQRKLDAGDAAGAVVVLEAAARKFPLNRWLSRELENCRRLAAVEEALALYQAAETIPARGQALSRLELSAELLHAPELERAVRVCRDRLNAEIAAEKAAREAAEKAAREAAEKAAAPIPEPEVTVPAAPSAAPVPAETPAPADIPAPSAGWRCC